MHFKLVDHVTDITAIRYSNLIFLEWDQRSNNG